MHTITDTAKQDHTALLQRLDRVLPARLHVFVGPEDGVFAAYAVEFDIVGQGPSKKAAMDEMFELLREYVQTAVELNELDGLVRPMPRSVVFRLQAKALRSRMSHLIRRHADWFAGQTIDHSRLSQELLA